MRRWTNRATAGAAATCFFASLVMPTQGALAADPAPKLKNKSFQISGPRLVLAPGEAPTTLGTTLHVREKDVIFSAPIGYRNAAELLEPVTASVAGLQLTMEAGAVLAEHTAKGGYLADLPADALVVCEEPKQDLAKSLIGAVTLGLTSLGARYSAWTQLCAVDADRDGSIEKLFLAGAKQPEDRVFTEIAPARIAVSSSKPIPDSRVDVVYFDGGALNSENVEFQVYMRGAKLTLDRVYFSDDPADKGARWYTPIKAKKLPHPIVYGASSLTVLSVDAASKTAEVRPESGFAPTEINWRLQPQYIYVYVPG